MKNFFKLATLLFACVAMSFVSCNDVPTEDWIVDGIGIKATVKSTAPSSATLEVQTSGLSQIAWQAIRTDELSAEELEKLTAPMSVVIFAKGEKRDVTNGTHSISVKNLSPNATYRVYIVGEVASDGSLTKEATVVDGVQTTDFNEDIRVYDVNYRGFSIDVKVDPKVKEEGNLIKWGAADLFVYNKNRYDAKGLQANEAMMNFNDSPSGYGSFYFDESTTLVLNEENSYPKNPDGTPNFKSANYYDTLVPGQPEVIMFGEFGFGQSSVGWGWGNYIPLFDYGMWSSAVAQNGGEPVDEAPYWDGFYYFGIHKTQEPEKLDNSLMDVQIVRSTDDAMITVTTDPSIEAVFIMCLGDEEHDVAFHHLGNTYEHFQWYATSYCGTLEGATSIYYPTAENNHTVRTALSEYFINVSQTSHYWVYVVGALGDIEGDGYPDYHYQVCKADDFDLVARTKSAPELIVEAVEPTKPNTASFRIFCPTAAEGNGANKGFFMANYEKDWLMSGMSAQELIDAYAMIYGEEDNPFMFSATDIDKINGEDGGNGLIVEFPSRPNENFHFAAMIKNDEGTATYSDKVVCRTYETPIAKVESEYFESLKGEWTASATVRYKKLRDDVDTEDESLTEEELYESKVNTHYGQVIIGPAEYPEVLPESVYDIYEQSGTSSREKVDEYYADLTEAIDLFNETNEAQNRILASGFDLSGEMLPHLPYFNFQSAYDLFTSTTYYGLSNAMPAYDFGPKWFFEVTQNGELVVPFNCDYYAPMGSWYSDNFRGLQEIHMIAYEPTTPMALLNFEGGITGYFPVEVSEDGNTITIKPMEYDYNGTTLYFYPNVGVYGKDENNNPSYSMAIYIVSEIVLTRNNGGVAPAALAPARSGNVTAPVVETIEPLFEVNPAIRPRKIGNFNEVFKSELQGPDHSLTREQRAEKWLKAWGRDSK